MSYVDWTLLAAAAVLVGFAKTAVASAGALAVALFVAVVPARESTGALLPLLLAGDLLAVATYRRHGSWPTLARLIPGVVPGLLAGTWFIALVEDDVMQASIGALLLALTLIQMYLRRQSVRTRVANAAVGGTEELLAARRAPFLLVVTVGFAAGFVTMTANAAGSVMTLYLILAGLSMLHMLGTAAWFFLVVNLVKLPFSAGLGLISPHSLLVDAALLPALAAGAWLGILLVRRIDQDLFERIALGATVVAAVVLIA